MRGVLALAALCLCSAVVSTDEPCCADGGRVDVDVSQEHGVVLRWEPRNRKAAYIVQGKELGSTEWVDFGQLEKADEHPAWRPLHVQIVQSRADEGLTIGSGFFRLSLQLDGKHDFNTETASRTDWIPYDCSADDMKAALEALAEIDTVYVVRSGPDPQGGFSWAITMPSPDSLESKNPQDDLIGRAVPRLFVTSNTLDVQYNSGRDDSVTVRDGRVGFSRPDTCDNDLDGRGKVGGAGGFCATALSGLVPGRGYVFRVRAYSPETDSYSAYSKVSKQIFTPRAPAPQALPMRVEAVAHDSITLALPKPHQQQVHVQVSRLSENTPSAWTTLLIHPEKSSSSHSIFRAGNLIPNTRYLFRYRFLESKHQQQQQQQGEKWSEFSSLEVQTGVEARQRSVLGSKDITTDGLTLEWTAMNDLTSEFQVQALKLENGRYSTEQLNGANEHRWSTARVQDSQVLKKALGRSEVQVIATRTDLPGPAIDAGTFRLAALGKMDRQTPKLAFDVSASELESALAAVGVKTTSVTRTGSAAHGAFAWTVVFDKVAHPGDLPPIVITHETLSVVSTGRWRAPGQEMVYVTTKTNGEEPRFFAPGEALQATVLGLDPYSWYSFRVREVYFDTESRSLVTMKWNDPLPPVRTALRTDPASSGDALGKAIYSLSNLDEEAMDRDNVELLAGSGSAAPRTLDDFYAGGAANGGTPLSPAGQPGLVVIRPLSSRSQQKSSSSQASYFFHTGRAQTYLVPDDPLIDQLEIRAWGGGGAGCAGMTNSFGGAGAFVQAVAHVWTRISSDNQRLRLRSLQVRVGGGGQPRADETSSARRAFGGGGLGGRGSNSGRGGGGGGGASSVHAGADNDLDVIVVAAGGGGAGCADYCCAHGGEGGGMAGGSPGASPDGSVRNSLEHVDRGFAPRADYAQLAQGGQGGSTSRSESGTAGRNGDYETRLAFQGVDNGVPGTGAPWRGGHGGNGLEGGGGGGGGLFGGGGGGGGVDGAGGGGGASFVDIEALFSFSAPLHTSGAASNYPLPPSPRLSCLSPRSIQVEWEKEPGVSAYIVEVSQGPLNENFRLLSYVSRSAKSLLVDDSVRPGTTYTYRVRVVSSSGGVDRVGALASITTPSDSANAWHRIDALPFLPTLFQDTGSGLRNIQELETFLEQSRQLVIEDRPVDSILSVENNLATLASTKWKPSPRFGHSAVALNKLVYVFGGMAEGESCEIGKGYGPANAQSTSEPGQPTARCRMASGTSNELWRFDTDMYMWFRLDSSLGSSSPAPRAFHSAVEFAARGTMLVFGGMSVQDNDGTVQTVGNGASEYTAQKDPNGRIQSFSVGDDHSTSSTSTDPTTTFFDELWELDPIQPTSGTFASNASVQIAGAQESITVYSDAYPASDFKDAIASTYADPSSKGNELCVTKVKRVSVSFQHPCPNQLRLRLMGPKEDAWNRQGELGMLLLDEKSSSLRFCPGEVNGGSSGLHTLTFSDRAAAHLSDYQFQDGEFRPASPLARYQGMVFHLKEPWTLRAVDVKPDGSWGNATIDNWEIEFEVFPCRPKPTWQQIYPASSSPPARHSHAAFATDVGMYVYGGIGQAGVLSDSWFFSFADSTWTQLDDVHLQDLQVGNKHRTTSSSFGSIFATPIGLTRVGATMEAEVFDFYKHEWRDVPTVSQGPIQRYNSAVVYESDSNSLLLFAGQAGATALGDIWRLELGNATETGLLRCDACNSVSGLCGAEGTAAGDVFQLIWQELCRRAA